MQTITHCPLCKQSQFNSFLTCKDYTVSHKNFDIVSCQNCSFKYTNPIPPPEALGDYYKSEEYISHSNTNKGIISKLYKVVRNYTLKGKMKLVQKHVSRGTILDYGCGTGMFLNVCSRVGWTCFGIEPDSGARKIASEMGLKTFLSKENLENECGSQRFDVITLWHVLEHVVDLEKTLAFLKSKLNPNGVLIIAVPNYKSYDAEYYKEYWAAYDVPRHLYHFEPKTISALLQKHNFKLKETLPMKFDSFYVSLLSEKYKQGKSNYLKAFLTGLKSNLRAKNTGNYSSLIYVFKMQ
ncbi:MAG: class I SAM-dependent methyltransferase [Bacteroidetes bacterium]|nr:class I SAM-dependent methyltransferase [Bacteroidota bacterium]